MQRNETHRSFDLDLTGVLAHLDAAVDASRVRKVSLDLEAHPAPLGFGRLDKGHGAVGKMLQYRDVDVDQGFVAESDGCRGFQVEGSTTSLGARRGRGDGGRLRRIGRATRGRDARRLLASTVSVCVGQL